MSLRIWFLLLILPGRMEAGAEGMNKLVLGFRTFGSSRYDHSYSSYEVLPYGAMEEASAEGM